MSRASNESPHTCTVSIINAEDETMAEFTGRAGSTDRSEIDAPCHSTIVALLRLLSVLTDTLSNRFRPELFVTLDEGFALIEL